MVVANIGDFLHDSKCAKDAEMKAFLKLILKNKNLITKNLYSAIEERWSYERFHELCKFKKPTVTLVELLDGTCIGGYTTA